MTKGMSAQREGEGERDRERDRDLMTEEGTRQANPCHIKMSKKGQYVIKIPESIWLCEKKGSEGNKGVLL